MPSESTSATQLTEAARVAVVQQQAMLVRPTATEAVASSTMYKIERISSYQMLGIYQVVGVVLVISLFCIAEIPTRLRSLFSMKEVAWPEVSPNQVSSKK